MDFFTHTSGMRKYEAADGCVSGDERDSRTNTHPPRTAIIIVSQKHCEHSRNISSAVFLQLVYFLSHLFSSTHSSFIYLQRPISLFLYCVFILFYISCFSWHSSFLYIKKSRLCLVLFSHHCCLGNDESVSSFISLF